MKRILLSLSIFFLFAKSFAQPITVNTTTYTVPQLVQDVLFGNGSAGSSCVGTISNITWSTGTNFGSTNGIGYFTNTNPNFPLTNGVVLSTGNAMNAHGPKTSILNDGSAVPGLSADMVNQAEFGYKRKGTNASIFATAFLANVSEQNWDFAGTGGGIRQIQRKYNSYGVELEGNYRIKNFSVNGSVTYTKAEIADDVITPAVNGNKPRRQADFIYNVVPTYKFGANKQHNFGFSVIGTTKSYAQDDNKLVMPGYAYVNPFLSFELTKGLSATVNVNNVFDTIGITEVEEGSITENTVNYVRARPFPGRSISMALTYKF